MTTFQKYLIYCKVFLKLEIKKATVQTEVSHNVLCSLSFLYYFVLFLILLFPSSHCSSQPSLIKLIIERIVCFL